MRARLILTIGLCGFLLACTAWAKPKTSEKAAVNQAKAWLGLVDQGKYASSWNEAAAYFKQAVTKKNWEQSMLGVRKPLGKILSRNLKSSTFATTLPGAPDGQYVVIQFETSFEHKKAAIETVTPMLDKDGKWRVAGYFIK